MKSQMNFQVVIFLTIASAFLFYGCPKTPDPAGEQPYNFGEKEVKRVLIEPKKVEGGKFEHYEPKELEPNQDKPFIVPDGPKRGDMKPLNKEIKPDKMLPAGEGGADDPVVFGKYEAFGTEVTGVSATAADMSVARNGQVVFASGNWYAALSLDGGNTFTGLDPTTILPVTDGAGNVLDGGWCCDQVIHYVQEFDLFVWLHQFCGNGANCLAGTNRIRIAVATTEEMINSRGTAWTYWDFTSANMGQTNPFDYPDLSIGTNHLYWSADVVNVGLMVVRVPLRELAERATITADYTDPADGANAYGAHLTQNTVNQIFWAGHVNSSTLRVFNLPDNSGSYSWRDININSWSNAQPSSISPNGSTDWLSFNFPRNAVIGAARSGDDVWFAWTAAAGGGFARANVQMVRININSFTFQEQVSIWNPDLSFAYPYLATNRKGELGISLAFGGGNTYYGSHGVGIWGDFVVWYPELSDTATARWGDYTTARRYSPVGDLWDAAGYTVQKTAGGGVQFQPHYIHFGRNSVVAANPN